MSVQESMAWVVLVAHLVLPVFALAAVARGVGAELSSVAIAGPLVTGAVLISLFRFAAAGFYPPQDEAFYELVVFALVNLTGLLAVASTRARLRRLLTVEPVAGAGRPM
jgi:hypothetical protein